MGIDDLFANVPVTEPLGDEETPIDQAKSIGDEARQHEEDSMVGRKDIGDPVIQD